ncbi:MAG: glycosyltransferase family 2 protein [Actinobacteria bacterium]|nr:glycosyltransferase family 2 protein [Actinomycetota bacterium]
MKIGILIVAYNAENTLVKVLDRIPVDFLKQIDAILVCDDASTDDTHNVGLRYQSKSQLPLTIVRHEINLGYGGNQKTGYQWALEKNLDLVVLLHGDGQYAPEYLPQMVAPIVSGSADVEIEIPTFYGDEISRVNGIKYGIKILIHTLKFRLSSNKSYF